MSKKDKEKESVSQQETTQAPQEEAVSQAGTAEAPDSAELTAALESAEKAMAALKEKEDQFLRLAAEYDNYRRRSQKEKESVWNDAKSETVLAFLPVYDNLERALKQETADEAFKKGVEMTMNQLKTVLEKLGITEIEALGQPFDPTLHNAVMHIEDENFGENTVAEVFQAGFRLGDKVVRFAMVKVAN